MSAPLKPLHVRKYGDTGSPVVVVHGGPGVAGYMLPVARRLGECHRVIEPFQRGSGEGVALTVDRHAEDLAASCREHFPGERPVLLGHSWGAMVALACTAMHPALAAGVIAINPGTYDLKARARLHENLDARTSPELRARLEALEHEIEDHNRRFGKKGKLIDPIYAHDLIEDNEALGAICDFAAHVESWNAMLEAQENGRLPTAHAAITCPVLLVSGADDPHPCRMVRDSLLPTLPQLEFVELTRCGHSPWKERHARDEFYRIVEAWIAGKTA